MSYHSTLSLARILATMVSLFFSFSLLAQTPPAQPETFLHRASEITKSIQKDFYNEKSGLYAQSLSKRDPEFMWGNGIMFSALVAATRHEPATYQPILDTFFTSLDRYWDSKAAIPGYEPSPTAGNGHDKYYDDNQWMVITFAEAFEVTHDTKFLKRAEETLKFSLSGWDDELGGGIWWHEKHKGGGKNTCANAPAAVAALSVARHRQRTENIEWAQKLVKWTSDNLQDTDGLFFDNKKVADGHIGKKKYTYNSALMIRANLGLYRATTDEKFLTEAKRISAACTFFNNPKTEAYHDSLRFTHLLVEADLELYRATNDPAILARAQHNGEVTWKQYQTSLPKDLIEQASIARMLWLLADQETDTGRGFWSIVDLSGHLGIATDFPSQENLALQEMVGKQVEVTGITSNRKTGACVEGAMRNGVRVPGLVIVVPLGTWPSNLENKTVTVTGVVKSVVEHAPVDHSAPMARQGFESDKPVQVITIEVADFGKDVHVVKD